MAPPSTCVPSCLRPRSSWASIPAGVVDYYVIGSPSGPYFKGGLSGVAIWVEREYHRAGPGGTGSAKAGGNYAASLLPQIQAEAKGFSQVCFLDTYEGKYLEELGGMNMFVVMADGTIRTPELTGVILEGGTRSAILRMLRDEGVDVREEKIALSEVVDGIRSGSVAEVFACGTAAVVTPITRLAGDDSTSRSRWGTRPARSTSASPTFSGVAPRTPTAGRTAWPEYSRVREPRPRPRMNCVPELGRV